MERIRIRRRRDIMEWIFQYLKQVEWDYLTAYVECSIDGEFRIICPGLNMTGRDIMAYVERELAPKTQKTWRERAEVIAGAICSPDQKREWLALIEEIEKAVKKEE